MVMKDKLEKVNHKALYFRFKKLLISVVILSSAFLAIAIPTYISHRRSTSNPSLAQENTPNVDEDGNENGGENKLTYLAY